MAESNWHEEQLRVDLVTAKIRDRITLLDDEVDRVNLEVLEIRKNFWDEVSINLGSTDDMLETQISIKQQADLLSERERRHGHTASALKVLKKLAISPYFGRIDFTEEGSGETLQIYVGIASFIDRETDTFYVYDWRAPVSSLYYDYGPGRASYRAPAGEIDGVMSLKRQFGIRDGQIHLLFDTGVTIGDELLMQVLSRHSDAQMKSIVATIQREQNQVIRNERSRMLIVQGAAGSGKTSAALQRVAYLLYKHRETLQANQMILFSPNPLFNSYVSTVLPELGEENMQQTTFQEYLEHRLGKEFTLEDPFSQIEYTLTAMDAPEYPARIHSISYKSSVDYLNVMRSYQVVLEQEGMVFRPIKFKGRPIVSAKGIEEKFYAYGSSFRLLNRIGELQKWLLQKVSDFEEEECSAEWVEEEIGLLDPEDYQRAFKNSRHAGRGKGVTFDDYDQEKRFLSRRVVKQHLKPVRRLIKSLKFVDVEALYRQLFSDEAMFQRVVGQASPPEDWADICRLTLEKLDAAELFYEDATPYLYLKQLVQGEHVNTNVRHLIIDEVQDYSPLQLEFMKRLFPRSRMTALGDLNQAIYAHGSVLDEVDTLSELYGAGQTEVVRLAKSYRSTREIVEFTRGMVPGGKNIEAFNRQGDKPLIVVVADGRERTERMVRDIESLKADGCESIAVICKTAAESALAYDTLCEHLPIRLITKYTPKFERETLVIPAYLAKGVEFDAVIIYDGSTETYGRNSERKLFYTACTRAMHFLYIYVLGEPSLFITAQAATSYEMR